MRQGPDRALLAGAIAVGLLVIAGLVLLAGVVATWRQVQLTRHQLEILREGQITERFTRAIEQLGSDNLDVRLGGIYALERIASSSKVDRGPILEVLTAYVRGHSPWPPAGWEYGAATPPEPDDRQLASLQFRKPDVQGADLQGADLQRADLTGANLSGADLRGAALDGAVLRGIVTDEATRWPEGLMPPGA